MRLHSSTFSSALANRKATGSLTYHGGVIVWDHRSEIPCMGQVMQDDLPRPVDQNGRVAWGCGLTVCAIITIIIIMCFT